MGEGESGKASLATPNKRDTRGSSAAHIAAAEAIQGDYPVGERRRLWRAAEPPPHSVPWWACRCGFPPAAPEEDAYPGALALGSVCYRRLLEAPPPWQARTKTANSTG